MVFYMANLIGVVFFKTYLIGIKSVSVGFCHTINIYFTSSSSDRRDIMIHYEKPMTFQEYGNLDTATPQLQ